MSNIPFLKFAGARISCTIERFRSEIRGVAALEFAIIAPILILMFVGTLEVSLAIAVNRKVSRISSSVSDLITQSQTLTTGDVDNIMDIAAKIMLPYSNTVGIVVTGIDVTGSSATVAWSRAVVEPQNAVGAPYTVPLKYSGRRGVSGFSQGYRHAQSYGWLDKL